MWFTWFWGLISILFPLVGRRWKTWKFLISFLPSLLPSFSTLPLPPCSIGSLQSPNPPVSALAVCAWVREWLAVRLEYWCWEAVLSNIVQSLNQEGICWSHFSAVLNSRKSRVYLCKGQSKYTDLLTKIPVNWSETWKQIQKLDCKLLWCAFFFFKTKQKC